MVFFVEEESVLISAPLAGDKQAERIDDDIATLRKIRSMADSLITPHPVNYLMLLHHKVVANSPLWFLIQIFGSELVCKGLYNNGGLTMIILT